MSGFFGGESPTVTRTNNGAWGGCRGRIGALRRRRGVWRMTVFVSYARQDASAVESLVEALEAGHIDVWFDRDLNGGDIWWDAILAHVREASLFLFALSENSKASKPCRAELAYAKALMRPILPVQVGPLDSLAKNPVAERQIVQFSPGSAKLAFALYSNILTVSRTIVPLPSPLPAAPELPLRYLVEIEGQLDSNELSYENQLKVVSSLHLKLKVETDEDVRDQIVRTLEKLRAKPYRAAQTEIEIEAVLRDHRARGPSKPTQPSGRPDPTPPKNPAAGRDPAPVDPPAPDGLDPELPWWARMSGSPSPNQRRPDHSEGPRPRSGGSDTPGSGHSPGRTRTPHAHRNAPIDPAQPVDDYFARQAAEARGTTALPRGPRPAGNWTAPPAAGPSGTVRGPSSWFAATAPGATSPSTTASPALTPETPAPSRPAPARPAATAGSTLMYIVLGALLLAAVVIVVVNLVATS
jgi:hypothetical protein